jgi:glycosyltransferase involved in cell wall biosynthesis
MDKLNILIIPPNDLLRHPIPNRLYHLGKRFAEKHNIFLLSYPKHPLANGEKVRSVKCVEVSYKPLLGDGNLGLYYVANAPAMGCALTKVLSDVDVVIHANIVPSLLAAQLAKKHGVPLAYDYLDHFPESASAYYAGTPLYPISHKVVYAIVARNLRASDLVVTVCFTLREIVASIVGDSSKVAVIPNGVDPELFKPMDGEAARRAVGLEGFDHVLLYYGSIDAWLSFETLLKLTKKLRSALGNVALVLVGVSHNPAVRRALIRAAVEHGLGKSLVLLPPQPHEKIPLFVNAADLVVAPYKRVAKNYVTPLKILETLACAKPVATTDIPEFKLWFRGAPIYYYSSESELEEIALKLLRHSGALREKLLKASEQVRTRFSWDALAAQYEGLLKALCR